MAAIRSWAGCMRSPMARTALEPVLLSGQQIDVPQRDELARRSLALIRRMLDWLFA